MIIEVSDLKNFERFIDCSQQMSAAPVTILFFKKKVSERITVRPDDELKTPFTDFTFVLCTPAYQVVFKGHVQNAQFEELERSFQSIVQSKNVSIHVEEFDSVDVKYQNGLITM